MSIALLDELMAPFLPPQSASARTTPAKAAKAANVERWRGVKAESASCEGLRIPANAVTPSQTFAGLRNLRNRPQSEQRCGFSQDSHDSQGWAARCAGVREDELAVVCWTDANIERFLCRRDRLLRWGWGEPEAEALAERLVKRDREQDDDRVSCADCRHYRPGRCGNHRYAGLHSPDVGRPLVALLQRCPGFETIIRREMVRE